MTMTNGGTVSTPDVIGSDLRRTARTTGIAGMELGIALFQALTAGEVPPETDS